MRLLLTIPLILALACGDDDAAPDAAVSPDGNAGDGGAQSDAYAFTSRFTDGSSVSYTGQTLRHLLIEDLDAFIVGLEVAIDSDAAGRFATADAIAGAMDFYLSFGEEGVTEMPRLSTTPAPLQETYADLGEAKSILGKLAGQDSSGARDHRPWNGGGFAGWDSMIGTQTPTSPSEYVAALVAAIAANGELRANGTPLMGPGGETLPPHVTADGLDLRQLLEKFLLGAVAFAQGSDDYLDEGLDSPNTRDEDAAYSELEHAWDEGFGYFGAPRDVNEYAAGELGGRGGREDWQGAHDSDGDGRIDFRAEYAFGASSTAAKRDADSTSGTTFATDAFEAFVRGRRIIAGAGVALTAEERTALEGERDIIVAAWESAIAATVVHYINEVLADLEALGTADYAFVDHAKHFSEMKGFALSFQFNPRSPLADFAGLHALLGDRPTLEAAGVAARTTQLISARDQLAAAYGFAAADAEAW